MTADFAGRNREAQLRTCCVVKLDERSRAAMNFRSFVSVTGRSMAFEKRGAGLRLGLLRRVMRL